MKITISKTELQNAVSIVMKGVPSRATIPSLTGILVIADKDKITLQTTNLDLSIRYTVAALVEEEGRALVPGKLFFDIIKNLPDSAVCLTCSDESALITCETSSYSIRALNPEDFPGFPTVTVEQQISIPFTTFANMVKRVSRAASRDESRAILTGIYINYENGVLRMVATDSYRLAVTESTIESAGEGLADGFTAVISSAFLSEIASLPKTASDVTLALAENQIMVTCDDTVFVNRRIEGNYPNYKQLLPETYKTRAEFDVEALVAGVRRASLLDTTKTPVKFDLNVASQTAQITSTSPDIGSSQETLSCTIEGEDVAVAFNYSYVLEGLSSISDEKVYLEVESALKPGIFRAAGSENFLYLVMPVRV